MKKLFKLNLQRFNDEDQTTDPVEQPKADNTEETKKVAKDILEAGKAVNDELKSMIGDIVKAQIAATQPPQVEKKMQFESKTIHANTQHGRDSLSPEMKSFVHWARTGEVTDRKALGGIATPSAGGYLVPEEFRAEIIRKMIPLTVMRRAGARQFTISGGDTMIPVLESSGQGGWVSENTAYTESEPTFGEISLRPNKYTRLVKASYEMLEDSAINVADLLSDIFSEDFAAAEDAAFVNGTGVGRPTGLFKAAITSVASTNTDDGTLADSLMKLIYALPRQYRNGSVFFLSGKAIAKVRLLKGANGQYLWESSLKAGEPDRLLGYPVFESVDIPEATIGAGPDTGSDIIFGHPKHYYIADRQGMVLERSNERFFELGQVAFRSDMRVDGKVALADGFRKLTGFKH
jgi:HK97 family phage major capsid protein